jgi:hypothetical protein
MQGLAEFHDAGTAARKEGQAMNHYYSGALLGLLLATASCDSLSDREAELFRKSEQLCPPSPEAGAVDYLPLEVGETWVFDYTSVGGDAWSGGGRSEGTLTWTFASAGACTRGQRPYQVEEVFDRTYYPDGGQPQPYTATNRITIIVFADSVLLPFYPEPVSRYGRQGGPDTLHFSYEAPFSPFGGYSVKFKLVRNRGIVHRSRNDWSKVSGHTSQFIRREGD